MPQYPQTLHRRPELLDVASNRLDPSGDVRAWDIFFRPKQSPAHEANQEYVGKRLEEWGEWMRETLLLDVPHRQVVFTIPKMLRVFFRFKRKLLGELCRCAERALLFYLEAAAGTALEPGIVAVIQTFGDRINFHPSKGWAAMIRKVYEVDPMTCPKCGGVMKVVAFITDYPAVDRIIDHLKLTFVAEKPPTSHIFQQAALMAAEERADHFKNAWFSGTTEANRL